MRPVGGPCRHEISSRVRRKLYRVSSSCRHDPDVFPLAGTAGCERNLGSVRRPGRPPIKARIEGKLRRFSPCRRHNPNIRIKISVGRECNPGSIRRPSGLLVYRWIKGELDCGRFLRTRWDCPQEPKETQANANVHPHPRTSLMHSLTSLCPESIICEHRVGGVSVYRRCFRNRLRSHKALIDDLLDRRFLRVGTMRCPWESRGCAPVGTALTGVET
jgi:hypothetical protein